MQSILLISDNDKLIDEMNIQYDSVANREDKDKLNLEIGEDRLYITQMNDAFDEYEEDEEIFVKKIFPNKVFFYLVCYTSENGIKDFISQLLFKGKIYVDDDQGHIIPFSEFKKKLIQKKSASR